MPFSSMPSSSLLRIRLHDCPYRMMDTVDMHLLFPNFDADPDDPAQYRFTQTDDYIQAICNLGAEVVYRLGESIEHYQHKSYVCPPVDNAKWARICVNIIRHYNAGWANGFHHGIRYWEIWNEPDLGPLCWTGSDAEFIALYTTAAKAIKAYDANLMVGGPAFARVACADDSFLSPFSGHVPTRRCRWCGIYCRSLELFSGCPA
jgi:xylan 1,4-beta-xylosidase